MEVDHEGYLWDVLKLRFPQNWSLYLWKTTKNSGYTYKYNGKLLKDFILGSIIIQFIWQKDHSCEEGEVMMWTILGKRQTRWKEVNGFKAYVEGRIEDILVNWLCEL